MAKSKAKNEAKIESAEIETTPATAEGIRWLMEMEAVHDPNFQNVMILNILKVSDDIQNVELLFDRNNKRLLVYVTISLSAAPPYQPRYDTLWQRWLRKDQNPARFKENHCEMWADTIVENVHNVVADALPSYQIRATRDAGLFDRATNLLRKPKP